VKSVELNLLEASDALDHGKTTGIPNVTLIFLPQLRNLFRTCGIIYLAFAALRH